MNIDNQSINSKAATRWIEMVQKQLIRENPSALPEYGVDGSYGPETVEWVEKFQSRKGLVVDGNAGPNTLSTLRSAIALLPGMTGRGIELLQKDLLYFYIQQSTVDGSYGPATEQGVRDFQLINDLVVDGNAGPSTLKTMDEYITTLLIQRGDNGSHVRRIQNQLNEQEEVSISIAVDGNYGPGTESAVEKFQNATDQKVDGMVGPFTMNLLDLEATHPLSEDDLEDFFASKGFSSKEVSKVEANKYVEILESNSVYKEVLSESNKTIVDPFVVEVFRDSTGLATIFGPLESNETTVIFATVALESNEVYSIGVIEVEGTPYDALITLTVYDSEGTQIGGLEETFLELSNEEVLLQTAFSEGWEEAQQVQAMGIDLTSCPALAGMGATVANSAAVSAGALLAGGTAPGIVILVGGAVLTQVFDEYFCD